MTARPDSRPPMATDRDPAPFRSALRQPPATWWATAPVIRPPSWPPLLPPIASGDVILATEDKDLSQASVSTMMAHPDERVAVRAIRRYGYRADPLTQGFEFITLSSRLQTIEKEEPGVWTPIHDAARTIFALDVKRARASVIAWVKRQADPARVVPLFDMGDEGWHAIAVRWLRVWDASSLERAWAVAPTMVARHVPANKHFPASLHPRLLDLALRDLERKPRPAGSPDHPFQVHRAAERTIAWAAHRGDLAPPTRARLLAIPLRWEAERAAVATARGSVHASGDDLSDVVAQFHGAISALRALASVPDVDAATFEELYQSADGTTSLIGTLIGHPTCPLSLVRRAVREHGSLTVRRAAMKRSDAIADPEVRALLAGRGRDSYVLTRLIESAPVTEGGAVAPEFGKLARMYPGKALGLLETAVVPHGTALPAATVGALLNAADDRTRTRAIAALPLLHVQETQVAPPPRTRRGR